MGELYALGWRSHGGPRQWQLNRFFSLDQPAAVARGLGRSDGGGRWRVYSTKLDVDDNGIGREVLDRMLAEGVAGRFAESGGLRCRPAGAIWVIWYVIPI